MAVSVRIQLPTVNIMLRKKALSSFNIYNSCWHGFGIYKGK